MSGDLQRQTDLETILRPDQIVAGRYRVERLMAEGGMAAVWAGVNQRTGKRVALKVILRSLAAIGEAAELFRQEALAASRVNHPNVVSIFDVIDHEGMTCIVMELLEGETLATYLVRKGPLGLDEAATLLLPAMRGVAAANAIGVVHRDLKPGNIFLCSDNEGRLLACKVLDFGISTTVERLGEQATATALLSMLGTPAYMSPEAIEGFPQIDKRADVYGLGVVFFEMLTGQVPFPGEPGTALLTRIVNDPPPKVTEYRPDLPVGVVNIIDCALAKRPDDRFPDVEHFIRALEEHLQQAVPGLRVLTPSGGTAFRGETVMLYSMAGEPLRKSERPALQGGARTRTVHLAWTMWTLFHDRVRLLRRQATIVGVAALVAGWGRLLRRRATIAGTVALFLDLGRFLQRRAAISAAVALFLILMVWLAFPRSSVGRGPQAGRSADPNPIVVSAHGPEVTPLPLPPSPAPAPAPAAVQHVSMAIPATGAAAPIPTGRFAPADDKPRRRRGVAPSVHRIPLRAGRLLPSDF